LLFFGAEMKETGIVLLVCFLEEHQQVGVDVGPIGNLQQLVCGFDLAVFTYSQKENAIDRGLHGIIELTFSTVEVGDLGGNSSIVYKI